jgi:folate-dependent phosphoribosylglycinamide formyltransferase PurN
VPAARLVVLVSGTGTNLQALLDACAEAAYGAQVVAVGADRDGIEGLARAERAGVPTFTLRVADFESRAAWDEHFAEEVAAQGRVPRAEAYIELGRGEFRAGRKLETLLAAYRG